MKAAGQRRADTPRGACDENGATVQSKGVHVRHVR
jgi:hypothetical protein